VSNDLRKQIRENFDLKETDEIVEIWTTNDRVEWSETAFDIMKEILEQRLGKIPLQNEPVLEHVDREVYETFKEDTPLGKFTDPDNAPVFYKPKEVLWMNYWLNRGAVAAVVVTIISSISDIARMQQMFFSYFNGNMEWLLVSWIIALIVGGLAIALTCFIFYFALKALASILIILMEMEFKSRT
jgi:hypothetical protein